MSIIGNKKYTWTCARCGFIFWDILSKEKCTRCYPVENIYVDQRRIHPFSEKCIECNLLKHKSKFKRNKRFYKKCNGCADKNKEEISDKEV